MQHTSYWSDNDILVNMRMCCDADFPSKCAAFGATQGLRVDSELVPTFLRQYVDHGLVPLATLDGVLRSIGAPAVDVVKIDVEGFECEVVRGGHTVFMGTNQSGRRPHTVRVELQSDPPLGLGMKHCSAAQFTRMLSPAYNVTARHSSPAGDYVNAVFELTRTHASPHPLVADCPIMWLSCVAFIDLSCSILAT